MRVRERWKKRHARVARTKAAAAADVWGPWWSRRLRCARSRACARCCPYLVAIISRSMIVAALAVMRLIYNSFDECEVPRFIAAAAWWKFMRVFNSPQNGSTDGSRSTFANIKCQLTHHRLNLLQLTLPSQGSDRGEIMLLEFKIKFAAPFAECRPNNEWQQLMFIRKPSVEIRRPRCAI